MEKTKFQYIYGPVSSWRLGSSLGIDLLSGQEKICTFDCIYCQVGRKKAVFPERKVYVPTEKILAEINSLPELKPDYITFSGKGEPTLALNLGETIKAVKKIRLEPVAVLTNASLLFRKDVREELCAADLVALKLDAGSQKTLTLINCPASQIHFADIWENIRHFRKEYPGWLALQLMFMTENKDEAEQLAKLVREIGPDEAQINTPTRAAQVKPLTPQEIAVIKQYFQGINVRACYDALPRKKKDTSARIGDIKKRRG
ncbi:MAG: radical SAM protein [Candidatus Omnitrophota bacterium]